jgi:dihydroorotase
MGIIIHFLRHFMINIVGVQTLVGKKIDLTFANSEDEAIQGKDLTLLPGLIDPHVHFRTPGHEYKEDWCTAAKAALRGGYTTVFDMPNTLPPTITADLLRDKKALIDLQLKKVNIPLRYQLFFGADKQHLQEIALVKNEIIGIKVFMGCSTGNLVIDDDKSLEAVFEIAAQHNLIVAVHAEDEHTLQKNREKFSDEKNYLVHSKIRNVEAAVRAVEKAINLTKRFGTRLYVLHMSTAQEVKLIKQAKLAGWPVYAETTPHHLFLDESAYATLKGKAVVNPPLRSDEHHSALWTAIEEGTIDTIGSDHAPHTLAEKEKPYGECPSGMPGIETTLPLLLNAHHLGLLTLEQIVSLTSKRAREIFNLPETNDITLVDLNKEAQVHDSRLKTKCAWSPYAGRVLRGWPVYTVLDGHCYDVEKL